MKLYDEHPLTQGKIINNNFFTEKIIPSSLYPSTPVRNQENTHTKIEYNVSRRC
jgi:hypothetical protein